MGTFITTDSSKTEFHFPLKLLWLNKVIFYVGLIPNLPLNGKLLGNLLSVLDDLSRYS